jgi:hypothetical protein
MDRRFFVAVQKRPEIFIMQVQERFGVKMTEKKLKNLNVFLEKTLAFFTRTW